MAQTHDGDEDGAAVGDTSEVHDTIHPRDLPPGHPGREAAEEKLAQAGERDKEGYAREGEIHE